MSVLQEAHGLLAHPVIETMNEEPSKCWNCGWTGQPKIEYGDIPDLLERLVPGDEVPSGECPKCGFLCYLPDVKP